MRLWRTTKHENKAPRASHLETGQSVIQASVVGDCLKVGSLCDDTDPADKTDPRPVLASSCRTFAFASELFCPGEPSTSKPLPWPVVRPIHNHVQPEFCITPPSEAIAAPQVWCRHCHASFPFPGATNGGTFTGAGQSYRRDLCRHIGYRPSSNRQPRMLVSQTDPFLGGLPAELYFHAWWCAR